MKRKANKQKKGVNQMTIRELKKRLDSIPNRGAINKARRAEIIALIDKLEGGR